MRGTSGMRFFVVVAAAAATLAACAALPYHEPPRPIVVLVHGRGQLGQDTAMLHREWARDIGAGLAAAGLQSLRPEDVRLAWYADILDPDSDSLCSARATSNPDSLGFGDFARGFLALLTGLGPPNETRELRGFMGDILYAVDPEKRCAAERRVGSVIRSALSENRPVIVMAYSLGSLVTYGWLRSLDEQEARGANLRLVTIGSPLGVPVIREMVFGDGARSALRFPSRVTSWENVYDPNDFLSAPLARALSRNGTPPLRDYETNASEREDPHNIERYLRDRTTGGALKRAICEATNQQLAGCQGKDGLSASRP